VGDFTKLDYAVNATALLAQIALLKGDLVWAVTLANRVVVYLPPDRARTTGADPLSRCTVRNRCGWSRITHSRFLFWPAKIRADLDGCFTDLVDAEASRSLLGGILYLKPRHLPLCVTISDSDLLAAPVPSAAEAAEAFRLVAAVELWEDYRQCRPFLNVTGASPSIPRQRADDRNNQPYLWVKKRGLL